MREFGARQVGAYDPFRLVLCEDAAAANHGSHMHKNEVTPQMASFFIPISEAAKTFTASAAAQKTEKRDVFQSAIPSARRAGSLGLCEGALRERKRA